MKRWAFYLLLGMLPVPGGCGVKQVAGHRILTHKTVQAGTWILNAIPEWKRFLITGRKPSLMEKSTALCTGIAIDTYKKSCCLTGGGFF